MRNWKVLSAATALLILSFLAGCQKDNPTQAPSSGQAEGQIGQGQTNEAFKSELEKAIQSDSPSAAGVRDGLASSHTISGPTTITESGIYRVVSDFSASSDGIVIQADFVLLDLNGHTISGPGNKVGRGIVLEGVSAVLVQDGKLQQFGIGIELFESNKSAVRNLSVEGGDEFADPGAGNPPQIGILLVNSYLNLIQNNEFDQINLGIFVRGGGSHDNLIRRNSARGGVNGLLGVCYNPAPNGSDPAGPSNDNVNQNRLHRFGVGIQTSAGSANNRFARNSIKYFSAAWNDFNGTNEFVDNDTEQITP